MATQDRDDKGRFDEKVREQDILKAFDFEATVDDPYLTATEVTAALARHWDIDVTSEAVRTRLEQMREDDLLARRQFGPSVAYRALVGPRLSDEVKTATDAVGSFDEASDYTSLDDLDLE